MKASIAERIQAALLVENLDGWLFYSFRGSDPIVESIPKLDSARLATRRWFYFVPALSEPQSWFMRMSPQCWMRCRGRREFIVPGSSSTPTCWTLLPVAGVSQRSTPHSMRSPIFRGDAATIELVRSFGVDVISSSDLVQIFKTVWTSEQVETHLGAAGHMRRIVDVTLGEVARRIRRRLQRQNWISRSSSGIGTGSAVSVTMCWAITRPFFRL
jgi:hypothetical protein